MGHVRLVHPKHWEPARDGFMDLAFKKPLSVFDVDCALAASGGVICAHIRRFYPEQGGDPPVFMVIEDAELPAGFRFDVNPSDTGDDCHREIDGVSARALKKALMSRPWQTYFICDPNGQRALTRADVASFSRDNEPS